MRVKNANKFYEERGYLMNEFMGTSEAAEKWQMSQAYITKLCRDGKIKGAEQDAPGKPWRIPINAENPKKKGINNE